MISHRREYDSYIRAEGSDKRGKDQAIKASKDHFENVIKDKIRKFMMQKTAASNTPIQDSSSPKKRRFNSILKYAEDKQMRESQTS